MADALSAGWMNLLPRPPEPNPPANPNQMLQFQLNKMKLDEAGREQSSANAFAKLFQNPNNLQNGMVKPEALTGGIASGAITPQFGMSMMGEQAKLAQDQARLREGQQKSDIEWRHEMVERFEPATVVYEQTLQQTKSPEAAQRAAQEKRDQIYNEYAQSGTLTPDRRRILEQNRKYDYATASANLVGLKGVREREDKARVETRENVRLNREAETEPKLYEVPKEGGGTEQKMLRYDKDNRVYRDEKGNEVTPSRPVATRELGADNAAMPPETLHALAEQYLAGDRTVMQNIGRGAQGSKNIVALRSEIAKQAAERGMSGADIAAKMAEYDGMKAGMRTLGTRTANIEMAVNEAQQLAPLAKEASDKVNRTQFPLLNSVLQAGERGTGDENVVQFGIAVNSLINTYARAINPTGVSRVSDIEHARELLSTAWSKGQINAGIEQLMKEMEAARRSPGVVRGEMSSAISGKTTLPGGAPQETKPSSLPSGGASAPIPPATQAAAPPIDVVPKAQRQDGTVVILADEKGAPHKFVVTDGGSRLRAVDAR